MIKTPFVKTFLIFIGLPPQKFLTHLRWYKSVRDLNFQSVSIKFYSTRMQRHFEIIINCHLIQIFKITFGKRGMTAC